MPSRVKYLCLISYTLFVCLAGSHLKAQSIPYLERTVTLKAYGQPLNEVFKIISNQTQVVFSYTQPFDDKRKISLICQKKPLRLVLNELLKISECTYKTKDKYIIIKCEGKPVSPPAVVTGYIYNGSDSTVIPQASIYVKQTKHSTVSNNYGFFSLSYSNKLPNITVSFAKEDYKDTSFVIYNQNKQEMLIYLFPKSREQKTESPAVDTISSISPVIANDSVLIPATDTTKPFSKKDFISELLERSKKIRYNLRNISDTLFSQFTISFTPYVSTNRLLAVNTVNKFALNIIGGYSLGTEALEIGGVFNIDKGDVRGTQVAGVFNMVGDSVQGVQLGGAFNVTGKQMSGYQAAGIMNLNIGHMKGVQMAGVNNINLGQVEGVSIAGTGNISDTLQGAALAGIFNVSGYSKKSFELSGLFNNAYSGKNNYQVSSIFNRTKKGETNSQLSVFYNRAHTLRGVQLGFVNYADSVGAGTPIGFLCIVKKGYHKIELATDELRFGTLAFYTGARRFYNIFLGGLNYQKTFLWTFGYGVGSDIVLKNKWGMTFNLTTQPIFTTAEPEMEFNLLNKFVVGVSYQLLPKIRIDLGPTCNLFLTDTTSKVSISNFHALPAFQIYDPGVDGAYIRTFVGLKLAIKFF